MEVEELSAIGVFCVFRFLHFSCSSLNVFFIIYVVSLSILCSSVFLFSSSVVLNHVLCFFFIYAFFLFLVLLCLFPPPPASAASSSSSAASSSSSSRPGDWISESCCIYLLADCLQEASMEVRYQKNMECTEPKYTNKTTRVNYWIC